MRLPSILADALANAKGAFAFKAGAPQLAAGLSTDQAVNWLFGFMNHIQDPDSVLLRAGLNRTALRALLSDDDLTGAVGTRRAALMSTAWRFENPSGAPQELVDWMWLEWRRVFQVVLRSSLEALLYGYSVQEINYAADPETGRITWGSVSEKPFEWFIPRLDGTVLYRSREIPQGQEVDPRKFFLTANEQTYRNPYGEAIFSRLYWPWFFRQQGWRFWVQWLERFGTPILIGSGPADSQTIANALQKAVQSATIGVPAGTAVTVVQAANGGNQFKLFDDQITERYQKLVLGQTLTTSMGRTGSFAAAQIHNEVRMDLRDSDIRMVSPVCQRMISTLWELNNFPGKPPEYVMADESGIEGERAQRDALLMSAGLKLKSIYFARAYDYEPEEIDEAAMNPPAPPIGQPPPGAALGNKLVPKSGRFDVFADAHGRFTPEQQVVEDELARVLKSVDSPIPADKVRAAILAATSYNDLVYRMTELFKDTASLQVFSTVLERALFVADITGFAHAKSELPKDH